jgi:ribosomal protein S18 acetylase RimI-like enzyme
VGDLVTLVDSTQGDEKFLFQVYSAVRRDEVSAWGWNPAQQDAFLRMQFMAQQSSYRARFACAAHSIICRDTVPVGTTILAREPDSMVLVDIALLPEHRRKGIGGQLLKRFRAEASESGLPLRLTVRRDNPAIKLYARTGFSVVSEDELHLIMETEPGTKGDNS